MKNKGDEKYDQKNLRGSHLGGLLPKNKSENPWVWLLLLCSAFLTPFLSADPSPALSKGSSSNPLSSFLLSVPSVPLFLPQASRIPSHLQPPKALPSPLQLQSPQTRPSHHVEPREMKIKIQKKGPCFRGSTVDHMEKDGS